MPSRGGKEVQVANPHFDWTGSPRLLSFVFAHTTNKAEDRTRVTPFSVKHHRLVEVHPDLFKPKVLFVQEKKVWCASFRDSSGWLQGHKDPFGQEFHWVFRLAVSGARLFRRYRRGQ